MAPNATNNILDPVKRYTIAEFLAIPNDLDESETELTLIYIVEPNVARNRKLKLHQLTATGAEFLKSIQAAKRVVQLIRTRGIDIHIPDGPTIQIRVPLEPTLTRMFRHYRNC